MQTTTDPTTPPTPEADPAPAPDEHARAKAYLDRWERHLVWLALHGLARAGRPMAG